MRKAVLAVWTARAEVRTEAVEHCNRFVDRQKDKESPNIAEDTAVLQFVEYTERLVVLGQLTAPGLFVVFVLRVVPEVPVASARIAFGSIAVVVDRHMEFAETRQDTDFDLLLLEPWD